MIASATKIFDEADIKVRVNPYKKYLAGGKRDDFIHVFAYILEGRSVEQKADLSRKIVQKLTIMFPKVTRIAMNISDFDKGTYFNRDML